MQARREAGATHAAQQEAHNRRQRKKAKVDWYSFGGTPKWGFKPIAKLYGIPPVWVWRLPRDEYQKGLDGSSSDDDDDGLGDYHSDRTF